MAGEAHVRIGRPGIVAKTYQYYGDYKDTVANAQATPCQEDEAETTLENLLRIETRAFAPDQGETAQTKYDLASVLLRKGQADRAMALLRDAVSGNLAPRTAQGLPSNPLFASLREDPRFKELMISVQKRFP